MLPESASFMSSISPWLMMVLPWFLLALGGSFFYKAFLALFWGRTRYWHGFLPISLVSPIFLHLPSSERSPVKTTHQWWVHILLGPLFLFLGLGCLASGADLLGMPGTPTVNSILTLGQENVVGKDGKTRRVRPLIVFDKDRGYSFPLFKRLRKRFVQVFNQPVVKEDNPHPDQQLQTGEKSEDDSE